MITSGSADAHAHALFTAVVVTSVGRTRQSTSILSYSRCAVPVLLVGILSRHLVDIGRTV